MTTEEDVELRSLRASRDEMKVEVEELKAKLRKLEAALEDLETSGASQDAISRQEVKIAEVRSSIGAKEQMIEREKDRILEVLKLFGKGDGKAQGVKRGRGSWKLSLTVPRGASHQNLRQRLFYIGEKCLAFLGFVRYSSAEGQPVSAESDLVAELYFADFSHALELEGAVVQALRERWHSQYLPQTTILESDVDVTTLKRVFVHRYQDAVGQQESPDRTGVELLREVEESSAATTVLDEEEIDRESVVLRDPVGCFLKFEKCHINAAIKGTAGDTTGNHIPLPSDWHDYFDAYTSGGTAGISIAPDGADCIGAAEADGRCPVRVLVFFDPQNRMAKALSELLRGGIRVRNNVFQVTVYKREPEKFVKLLQERHDAVVQKWSRVP